jgi:hypothetical protein
VPHDLEVDGMSSRQGDPIDLDAKDAALVHEPA